MAEPGDLSEVRAGLMAEGLRRADLKPDPVAQFDDWLGLASDLGLHNADAMAVATVGADGVPSVRNVLLRGFGADGFVFYTNRESQKGVDLASNPHVEALFSWLPLERQVRVRGLAAEASDEMSDAYWATRARGSQVAALTSDQSRPVESREWLERRARTLEAAHDGLTIARPDHWGGYVIVPDRFEFWQGREFRLHDRLSYERLDDGSWQVSRLAP